MDNNYNEYIGYTFNYLKILNVFVDTQTNKTMTTARCSLCGTIKDYPLGDIIHSHVKSCGCLKKYFNSRQGKYERFFNRYILEDPNTVRVFFNNVSDKSMLCDTSTWFYLNKYIWFYHKSSGYATTNLENGHSVTYHIMILECPKGYVRDHINRDRLDNRLCNLRVVNQHANCINRTLNPKSGVVGVTYDPSRKRHWRSSITYYDEDGKKRKYSGSFYSKEEAIEDRKEKEKIYYQIESLTTNYLNYNENASFPVVFPPSGYDYDYQFK